MLFGLAESRCGIRKPLEAAFGRETYGSHNTLAEWGYNRDRESQEQVNLALMTSVESGLPLWYTVLPGSMSDRTVME